MSAHTPGPFDRRGETIAELRKTVLAERNQTDAQARARLIAERELKAERERSERLRAAVESAANRLAAGVFVGTGPSTGEPLGRREKDIIIGMVAVIRAALAPAQPDLDAALRKYRTLPGGMPLAPSQPEEVKS